VSIKLKEPREVFVVKCGFAVHVAVDAIVLVAALV